IGGGSAPLASPPLAPGASGMVTTSSDAESTPSPRTIWWRIRLRPVIVDQPDTERTTELTRCLAGSSVARPAVSPPRGGVSRGRRSLACAHRSAGGPLHDAGDATRHHGADPARCPAADLGRRDPGAQRRQRAELALPPRRRP